MLKYKGYIGHFRFDDVTSIFCGQVANTHDLITFQGESVEEVRVAFQDAIDKHLVGREKHDEWGF